MSKLHEYKIHPRTRERNDKDFRATKEGDMEQIGEESSVTMTPFASRLWEFIGTHWVQKGKLDPEWQVCKLLGMGRKTLRVRLGNDTHWTLEDMRKLIKELQSEEFAGLVSKHLEGK